MEPNPWLRIPAEDYEAHMSAIGQAAALRDFFSRVYAQRRPKRLAVLGCTTGSDLEQVDPFVTEMVVGVDVNRDYLDIAKGRLAALGSRLQLIQGDVLQANLPLGQFDLVYAALLLEYVDPASLFGRMHQWLSPDGTCSVVTQDPVSGVAAVSETGYESLQNLAAHMTLRHSDEVEALADRAGFRLVHRWTTALPNGRSLVSSTFEKVPGDAQPGNPTAGAPPVG